MKLGIRVAVLVVAFASVAMVASGAFSAEAGSPDTGPAVDRWWGADRYRTAVDVSQANFPSGADTVIIATGLNYPDALAGADLASAQNAPILLVKGGSVPESTLTEIRRLGPSQIFILGGIEAVPMSAENVLDNVAPVTRAAGPDRYGTAIEISRLVHPGSADTVYIAPGRSFPESSVIGPVAASTGGALLLVPPTWIPGALARELKRLSPSKIVVVGGGGVIAQSVVDQLSAYANEVVSITGATRYDTGVLASQATFPDGADTVLVARGDLFPDALSGSAVAARLDAPVLLVKPDSLPSAVAAELIRLDPTAIHILGGSEAVSDGVLSSVTGLFNDPPPRPADPDVFAIGDSVLQGVVIWTPRLTNSLPNTAVDAVQNRPFSVGKQILADWLASGNDPDVVVVHLGTNGSLTAAQFADFMSVASVVPRVLFLTIKQSATTWETTSNELFHAEVPKYDNTELVDWYAVATAQLDMDAIDPNYGAHLWSTEAREVYVDMIVDAVVGE